MAGIDDDRLGRYQSYMTTHIKLYGEKAERFEAIKSEMSEKQGYEPTNPEVIGLLLATYNGTQLSRDIAL